MSITVAQMHLRAWAEVRDPAEPTDAVRASLAWLPGGRAQDGPREAQAEWVREHADRHPWKGPGQLGRQRQAGPQAHSPSPSCGLQWIGLGF